MKIILVESCLSGHHKLYLNALKKNDNTEEYIDIKQFCNNRKTYNYYYERFKYSRNIIKKYNNSNNIIHILALDYFFLAGDFFIKNFKGFKVIATLHKVPNRKLDILILKRVAKSIRVIVVHSEYIQNELRKIGIFNTMVVNYPAFNKYDILSGENSEKGKKVISLLGETRYNKGLDIFLESLQYLDDETKNNILINIVGPERDFNYDFIKDKLNKYNIEYNLNLSYVSDCEFKENIEKSDIVVFPYRNSFNGNSGPLTEAAKARKKILSTNYGNLGFLVKKYNLGEVFNSEDPVSLAISLEKLLKSKKKFFGSEHYYNSIDEDYFIKEYSRIYKQEGSIQEDE